MRGDRAIGVVAAMIIFVTTPALGQECDTGSRRPSRYCFALDLIDALRIAHNAYTLYGDTVGLAPCLTGDAADFIYRAKQLEQAFGRALMVLRPYAASPDSTIHLSREALVFAYLTHLKSSRDAQRYCGHLADGSLPPGLTMPSQIADSAAKARLALNNATEMMIVALGELSDGLAEIDPATNRLTTLRLSAEQRKTLLTMIESAFGPEVRSFDRNHPKMLSTDFATVAATFYNYLADKGWRLQPLPSRQ